MKIGFIGTGVMGFSMATHILNAGYELYVYNRTKEKARPLVKQGARWADTPQQIAEQSDIILTIVGYPDDVHEVYFGEEGLFRGVSSGQILIDLTTSTPTLARQIARNAEEIGAQALDAPVSGGDIGAKKGILTTMVGGGRQALESVRPVLETFASQIQHFGEAGSGQMAKVANQIMVAGTMTGLTEMFVYAKKVGLDLETVIETVSSGAAQNFSLDSYGPRIIQKDYTPGFFVKHFVKDLKIALKEAERLDLQLPAIEQAYQLYQKLMDAGYGDDGTQALVQLWWGKEKDKDVKR